MARALKGTLTLCLALGLTSFAWGQGQLQPSVLGPVLSNPDVQKELKLSEEQISKLKDALNKVMDKYKDDFAKLARMSPEEQQKMMRALIDDSHKAMAGILDAKQMKRLKQIEWQIAGVNALQDPDLQKELKLNDEQKKKLDGLFNDANKKMQQLFQSQERSPEKYQAVVKELEEKANSVLSEEQQKNFKELKGPRFQFSLPSPPKSIKR
jgi:hypothetical protein